MQTVKTIILKDQKIILDDEDLNLVSSYIWRISPDRYVHGYKKGEWDKDIRLHRLIMHAQKGQEVDHINRNTLDNRKDNLRICNRYQNKANTGIISTNTTGYKGVSRHKGKWQASVRSMGKLIYLGRYETASLAAQAYNTKALELWGNFAWLNKIRDADIGV